MARPSTNSSAPRAPRHDHGTASEETPLLAEGNALPPAPTGALDGAEPTEGPQNGAVPSTGDDKPLPVTQILLLCFVRVIEPIAFFSIFPYVNQMVKENGNLPDEDVGFYSGVIESLFSLTQALVMILWGRAADRLGRKPVLVVSLVGVSCAIALFGLAKTIPQMILFRCTAGVFAGTIVTVRTMIAEHSTSKTQARAFSWFAFAGNLGIFFGPLLGGALADPAGQYHGPFERVPLFVKYPYFLSSFVVALLGAVAAIVAALFIEETLVRTKPDVAVAADRAAVDNSEVTSANGEASTAAITSKLIDPSSGRRSIKSLMRSPGVGIVFSLYLYIAILAFAYTAIVPVFWFSPISIGGYELSPVQISLFMGLTGAAQAAWLLLVFPPLQRVMGTNGVMRLCANAYPFFFALIPLGNVLLRIGTPATTTAFWATVPPLMCVGVGVSMCFTAVQLALNDVAPSPEVLGTLNALALTGSSVVRSFTPALFTSLFAVGARTQWLHGYAIWVVMVVLGLGFTIGARYLPDYEELKRRRVEQEEEERESLLAEG